MQHAAYASRWRTFWNAWKLGSTNAKYLHKVETVDLVDMESIYDQMTWIYFQEVQQQDILREYNTDTSKHLEVESMAAIGCNLHGHYTIKYNCKHIKRNAAGYLRAGENTCVCVCVGGGGV